MSVQRAKELEYSVVAEVESVLVLLLEQLAQPSCEDLEQWFSFPLALKAQPTIFSTFFTGYPVADSVKEARVCLASSGALKQ